MLRMPVGPAPHLLEGKCSFEGTQTLRSIAPSLAFSTDRSLHNPLTIWWGIMRVCHQYRGSGLVGELSKRTRERAWLWPWQSHRWVLFSSFCQIHLVDNYLRKRTRCIFFEFHHTSQATHPRFPFLVRIVSSGQTTQLTSCWWRWILPAVGRGCCERQ